MTQPPALNLCAKSTFNQFLEVILAGTICDRVMRSITHSKPRRFETVDPVDDDNLTEMRRAFVAVAVYKRWIL
jgi:hypothetical protein